VLGRYSLEVALSDGAAMDGALAVSCLVMSWPSAECPPKTTWKSSVPIDCGTMATRRNNSVINLAFVKDMVSSPRS
jgi:hypothetical protein